MKKSRHAPHVNGWATPAQELRAKQSSSMRTPDSKGTRACQMNNLYSHQVVAAVPSQEIWLRAQSSARGESLDASGRWNLNLPKNVYYTSFVVDRLNIGRIQSAFSFLRSGLAARHGDSYLPYLFTRSFAKAFFGQYYRMPGVVAEAQADYGNQLLILKQDLSSPESTDYPSLFYGIMAAVMYEFVTMTTPYAWSWHVSALARMVESRGPEAYRQFHDAVGLAICRLCRALIIGNATSSRKRTFLERPEWMIGSGPGFLPKALEDEFTDVQYLPGLLEDYDTLLATRHTRSSDPSAYCDLYLRVLTLANILFAWRWAWERQNAYHVWLVPSTNSRYVPRDPNSGEPLYSTLIYFSDYYRWNEIQRYNSLLLLILDLAQAMHGNEGFLSDLDRSVPPDLIWIRDICGQIATMSGFHVGSRFIPSKTVNKELQWSRFYLAKEEGQHTSGMDA
ncbi:MAG: hypothetical protein LQ352_003098 [Teloschistes flavicans]|nr:MAG: hypothetical protein LQ352_003098 [Teloschistes flavicans]